MFLSSCSVISTGKFVIRRNNYLGADYYSSGGKRGEGIKGGVSRLFHSGKRGGQKCFITKFRGEQQFEVVS